MVLPDREMRFRMIPKGLYYFDAADRDNSIKMINTVLENCKGFTQR